MRNVYCVQRLWLPSTFEPENARSRMRCPGLSTNLEDANHQHNDENNPICSFTKIIQQINSCSLIITSRQSTTSFSCIHCTLKNNTTATFVVYRERSAVKLKINRKLEILYECRGTNNATATFFALLIPCICCKIENQ